MAQYFKYTKPKYQYWTFPDGRKIRQGQNSSGEFVTEIEYYVGGFADANGVDQVGVDVGTLTGNFYYGIRDCAVELLVGTNPLGTEGVDYEHL